MTTPLKTWNLNLVLTGVNNYCWGGEIHLSFCVNAAEMCYIKKKTPEKSDVLKIYSSASFAIGQSIISFGLFTDQEVLPPSHA